MGNYITVDGLKATLSLSGTTVVNADITAAISAAEKAIENYCGQRFYADSAATYVRYYDAMDPMFVAIDPAVSVATVSIDQTGSRTYTDAAAADWELSPYNAATDSEPYTAIEIAPMGSVTFPPVRKGVKVIGKFGWPAVPGDVAEAAGILASRYFKRAREAPFGVAGFGIDGAAVRITRTDPDVAQLLEPYVKRRLFA